jgi:NADH:ubiquinone oxidoreductase subunit 2 (subunit N)
VTLLTAGLLWLLFVALLAGVLRRLSWLPGVIVAVGLALLAIRLWTLPEAGTATLLGQTIFLDESSDFLGFTLRLSLAARGAAELLLFWGVLFALATAWLRADRALAPSIPLILAALILALSSAPLLWAPLWLVIAAVLMAFPAQGATPRLARAALRTLLAPTLAFPFFLFTAWVLGQTTIAADDPALWINGWRSLVIGVLLLLTPVPLHGWITAQGEHAPPLTAAFLVGVWQITVYALVRHIFLDYATVADYIDPARWLPWLAVIQMGWGAIFSMSSNRLGQLWGYLLLWSYGAAFLAWSISGEFGTQTMVGLFLVTPLALILVAAGLQAINTRFGENTEYATLHGVSERLPVATLAVVGGGLILLGWPLGALFPVRLATFRLAETTQSLVFLWAMLSLLLATVGLIRLLRALARPLSDPQLLREPSRLAWLILPLLLAGLLLSLNPALLDPITARIADWLTLL